MRIPDNVMAVLWNPGTHAITLRRNTTNGYTKVSDYIEKSEIDQQRYRGKQNTPLIVFTTF